MKVPLQASAADDPFNVSLTLEAVDDSVTRVSESVEEQGAGSSAAARAALLGPSTQVATLCGTTLSGPNAVFLGSVTTAGAAGLDRQAHLGGNLALQTVGAGPYSVVGNTTRSVPAASGVLSNYAAYPAAPGGAVATLSAASAPGSTPGSNSTLNSDGSFTFTPKVGDGTGSTETLGYRVSDNAGCTSPALSANVPVSGRVWYVDNTVAGGDGRSDSPFQGLSSVSGVSSAGDTVYVAHGSGATSSAGFTLKASQRLIGGGVPLTLGAATLRPADPAGAPTLSGAGLTLAQDNELAGLNLNTAGGAGIAGTSFGTLTTSAVSVTAAGGPALDLTGGTVNGTLDSASSTNSTSTGLKLKNTAGTLNLNGGSISGAAGAAFSVSGGSVNVVENGTITQANNAALVDVSGTHTGTLTFGSTLSATGGTGLQFSDADGTYNFNAAGSAVTLSGSDAGVDILNGSGGTFAFGKTATPGSFVITSPSGPAMNIAASSPTVTYNGNITQGNNAALLNVTDQASGTVTFAGGTLSATNGSGVTLSNVDGNVNLNGTTTLNGGNASLNVINGSSGTINLAATSSITNPSGAAVNVTGSSSTLTYGGTISKTNGSTGISVSGNTGGAVNFSGSNQTLTATSTNVPVNLTSNTNTTINFSGGGLALTSATGNALNVSGGGTVTVTGSGNTATSVGGTAISVANTNIGAAGLTFRSVNANGGANGILLNTTGTAGGLSVTGTGSAGSGGTIQNTTGADGAAAGNGVYLNSTANTSLKFMTLSNHSNNALYGAGVRGLTLDQISTTGNNGTSNSGTYEESGVHLVDLGGTVNVTNSTLNGGAWDGFLVRNNAGTNPTLNLTFSNNIISQMQGSTSDVRNTAFQVIASDGTANVTALSNLFTYWWGNAMQVGIQSNATGTAKLQSNRALQTSGALAGAGGIEVNGGNLTFDISNNTIAYTNGTALSVDKNPGNTYLNGTINSNQIGYASGSAGPGGTPPQGGSWPSNSNSGSAAGTGIYVAHSGPNTTTVKISNNTLRQINGTQAMWTLIGDDTGGNGSGTMNATITGNNIAEEGSNAGTRSGIVVQSGRVTNDTDTFCADLSLNSITNFSNRIRPNQRFNTKMFLPGYTGASNGTTGTPTVATYLTGRNSGTVTAAASSTAGGGGYFNTPGGAACPQPTTLP
ncbi:hypothetical protein MF271_20985 (plasmid) [Deinococcus sp. KNUC1210]|uniref:beta strand repeat-containing protein n=1 Tax=Deinococcus sp. KNUC1210 TaxID=2917691 RepID=UPI001EF13567|nr:hypothetical protein [Deinococcus sp. KNUC1210]ULH17530.1 hypothetical protein MF271_20985 [Deinococcus sp. KNUC1210]